VTRPDVFGHFLREETMSKVHALYVDPKGLYPKLLGPDNCWDETRDAREYDGAGPVIAHPPCQLWVNMAAVNWKRYKRQLPAWYPGGDDGNCFKCALADVLSCGGVLEHPAGSHAFAARGIPKPKRGSWQLTDMRAAPGLRVWVTEVSQSAYGHDCRKRTWLVFAGEVTPFDLDWSNPEGTHQIGWFDRNKPTLGKRAASATPPDFAELLICLASWSRA
jgi:hypothetical protein